MTGFISAPKCWGKWIPTVVLWLVCFGNALAYICNMDIRFQSSVTMPTCLTCTHWFQVKQLFILGSCIFQQTFKGLLFSKFSQLFEHLASKMFPNQRYGGRPHLHVFARTPRVSLDPNGWCIALSSLLTWVTKQNTLGFFVVCGLYHLVYCNRYPGPSKRLKGDVLFWQIRGSLRQDLVSTFFLVPIALPYSLSFHYCHCACCALEVKR